MKLKIKKSTVSLGLGYLAGMEAEITDRKVANQLIEDGYAVKVSDEDAVNEEKKLNDQLADEKSKRLKAEQDLKDANKLNADLNKKLEVAEQKCGELEKAHVAENADREAAEKKLKAAEQKLDEVEKALFAEKAARETAEKKLGNTAKSETKKPN